MRLHDTAVMLTSNQSRIAVVRPYQSNLNEPNSSHTTQALCSTAINWVTENCANQTPSESECVWWGTSELQVRIYSDACTWGCKSPGHLKALPTEIRSTENSAAQMRWCGCNLYSNTSNHAHKHSFWFSSTYAAEQRDRPLQRVLRSLCTAVLKFPHCPAMYR